MWRLRMGLRMLQIGIMCILDILIEWAMEFLIELGYAVPGRDLNQ
jgi:hypothetical protein